jgi:hypothetical protein
MQQTRRHEFDTWHPAPHGEVVVSIERAASVANLSVDDQELAPLPRLSRRQMCWHCSPRIARNHRSAR